MNFRDKRKQNLKTFLDRMKGIVAQQLEYKKAFYQFDFENSEPLKNDILDNIQVREPR